MQNVEIVPCHCNAKTLFLEPKNRPGQPRDVTPYRVLLMRDLVRSVVWSEFKPDDIRYLLF